MKIDRRLTMGSVLEFMESLEANPKAPGSLMIYFKEGFEIEVKTNPQPKRRSIFSPLKLIYGKVKAAKKAAQQPGHKHGAGGLRDKPNIRIV